MFKNVVAKTKKQLSLNVEILLLVISVGALFIGTIISGIGVMPINERIITIGTIIFVSGAVVFAFNIGYAIYRCSTGKA